MKNLYRLIGLIFLFGIMLAVFGQHIPEIATEATASTTLQEPTFPLLYLQVGDYTVNTLHGYSNRLDCGDIRESITPLDTGKNFTVKIAQDNYKIMALSYVVKDIANNRDLETNSLSAFDTEGSLRTVPVTLNCSLDTGTEYGLELSLTTNSGREIHYYTRIKYYTSDFYLTEKMDFIADFHDATLDKKSDFDITPYLEAHTSDDSTFADVNIHSDPTLITWKKLKPTVLSDVTTTIREINIETMSATLEYYVQLETDSGFETYYVKESYRVRCAGKTLYLLDFDRKMEAFFDPSLISLKRSEFKVGVTNLTEYEYSVSDSEKKFAFVLNGNLWFYDLTTNTLVEVFSFLQENADYEREYYNRHDIKILRTDDSGDISFLVYGYMNSGDYEGHVGMVLYDYSEEKNCVTERVYIPLDTTYQRLKEDLGEFAYLSETDIFYFSLGNTVYSYNITARRCDVITDNAISDHFSALPSAKCFIKTTSDEKGRAKAITILDLDSGEETVIEAPKKQSLVLYGTIDENIVYGYVKNADISELTTGETLKPAYRVVIADCTGQVVRKYRVKGYYVTDAQVTDNVITLNRVKKQNGRFAETTGDSIMNQQKSAGQSFALTTRVTSKMLTEKYISMPAGYVMEKSPQREEAEFTVATQNTTFRLEGETDVMPVYYVYAYGDIVFTATSAQDAIIAADEAMGVVMDNRSHVVWERGGSYTSRELTTVNYPENTTSSVKACTQMLLACAQVTVSPSDLSGDSILSMLTPYLDQPVTLTGCTLSEVLYFVSSGKPVIAMTDDSHAVLITEYTSSSVTYMDPSTKTQKKMSQSAAEKLFAEAGNRFVSYVGF